MWKFAVVFFTSSVKFLFAPMAALGFKIPWWETVLLTSAGGVFGVLVFYNLAAYFIQKALQKRKLLLIAKRQFTPINKAIVKVKRLFGQFGIVFLTLPFISIPLCAIISYKFFKHKRSTLPLLISSVLIWSVLLTSFYAIF